MSFLQLFAIVMALILVGAFILVYACLCVSSECSRQEEEREEARRG